MDIDEYGIEFVTHRFSFVSATEFMGGHTFPDNSRFIWGQFRVALESIWDRVWVDLGSF